MDESNQTRRDSELLANFVSHRDEDSFEALVDKYLPLVLGVAIRRTGSRAIAEEIAQNVFTLLAQKARRLRSHPTIGGWLMKTTAFESMRAN
ncbi:MAG: sigma factor, partial [Verrucomicrobia bacterium]|nr:sigma factor [Verrucomicrobiota bacterium]